MAVDPKRAKTLFLAASDLSAPAERAAFLDRVRGLPEESPARQRLEAALAPDQAAATVAQLDAVTRRQQAQGADLARHLTRPEAAVLGRLRLRVLEAGHPIGPERQHLLREGGQSAQGGEHAQGQAQTGWRGKNTTNEG